MSFLTTDYSNVQDNNYDALPTGEYEMIIANAKEDATPSGAETLQLDLVVRNDVKNVTALSETNGKYANRHVFMDNWKRKATKQYDTDGFMTILYAAGVPEGTAINSIQDFINAITNKPVRVYVKKQVDDYKTEDPDNPVYQNRVAPWNFSPTKFKEVNHQRDAKKAAASKSKETISISDEDIPF